MFLVSEFVLFLFLFEFISNCAWWYARDDRPEIERYPECAALFSQFIPGSLKRRISHHIVTDVSIKFSLYLTSVSSLLTESFAGYP